MGLLQQHHETPRRLGKTRYKGNSAPKNKMNDTRAVKALSWGRGWCPPGPGLLPTLGGPGLSPRVQHRRFPPGAVPVTAVRREPRQPRRSPAPWGSDPGGGSCPRPPTAGTGSLTCCCTDRGHCSVPAGGSPPALGTRPYPRWRHRVVTVPGMGSVWAEVY